MNCSSDIIEASPLQKHRIEHKVGHALALLESRSNSIRIGFDELVICNVGIRAELKTEISRGLFFRSASTVLASRATIENVAEIDICLDSRSLRDVPFLIESLLCQEVACYCQSR